MKTQSFAIITTGIVITSLIVISILFFQISILQDQTRILNETNQKLATNLTNYQDLFGDISVNYTEMPLAVKTSVYIAGPIDTMPVTEVKVNHRYQVISNITKIENTQPIIYYYCIVQVINATGLDPHVGWGQGSLLSKQTFSQCATSWTPTTPGNYTINAFAWRTLFGSPLSEAATRYVQVVSSSNASTVSIKYANGTSSLPINYTITEDNKLLDAKMDTQSKSIILSLNTTSNGTLTVSIPRALLDSKENNQDMQFIVLVDGQEVKYAETTSLTERTLTIPFELGAEKIEIVAIQRI